MSNITVSFETNCNVTAAFDELGIIVDVVIPSGGSGDMLASVYDPAGGAKQVAFVDEIDPNLWEADGDETIRPKPLEGGEPVKVKVEYIDGAMDAATYDPTNRAEPVAFESDLQALAAQNVLYLADSFTVVVGGDVTGTVENTHKANDGNTLRVNESAGGLTVQFTFLAVENFNYISTHLRYVGGGNHRWQFELYNWVTNQFDIKGETLGSQEQLTFFNIDVPLDADYRDVNGQVLFQFRHLPNFITSHYIIFDFVGVVASLTAGTMETKIVSPLVASQLPVEVGDNLQAVGSKLLGHTEATANAHSATAITFVVEEITGAKTIEPTDSGKHFFTTAAADFDITLNVGLTHPISVSQEGAGVYTYKAGAGVTLKYKVKSGGAQLATTVIPRSTTVYEIIGGVA